eukprot:COSAG01_NODE_12991_length_1652_cov_2.010303_3_plen_64_part_00
MQVVSVTRARSVSDARRRVQQVIEVAGCSRDAGTAALMEWLIFPYFSVHFIFGSYHDDTKTEM